MKSLPDLRAQARCSRANKRTSFPTSSVSAKALTGGTVPLGSDRRDRPRLQCISFRRCRRRADAWADVHGVSAWLRRRERVARSVRKRAAIGASPRDRNATQRRIVSLVAAPRRSRRTRQGRNRRRSNGRARGCDRIASAICRNKAAGSNRFGDVIYLTPPFVIEPNDLSKLTRAIVDEVRKK